jgi:hypothetical protein
MKAEKHYLKFKEITIDNWFEPDETSLIFCEMNKKTGDVSFMSGSDWAKYFLEPQLNPQVPIPVQRLFEVARGTLIYGFFFYPLFTLGIEQLSRVSESAITEKCLLLSIKKRKDSFIEKLKALKNQNFITETDFEYWDKTRHLRNYFSHPENQNLFPPGISFEMLKTTTQKINELFI